MLAGYKFASDIEVQWAVHQWLAQQPTSFFFHRAFTNLLKDETNVSINLEDMLISESTMPKEFTFEVLNR